ncbi:MAG: 2-isopropylmalate synthase, partial [Chloroflexi bacterium]|nr:2-isopropylmalate synthase [Chloroflexota bacterium]
LPAEIFGLDSLHVTSGTSTPPTATICLQVQGQRYQEAAWGTGPVDALYRAIDRITSLQCRLEDYSLKAVTSGQDALGEVTVRVAARRGEEGEVAMLGRGVSTDIIEASVKAYLAAVNKLCLTTGSHPMPPEALRVKEAVSQ